VDEVPTFIGPGTSPRKRLAQGLNAQEVLLDLARDGMRIVADSAAALEGLPRRALPGGGGSTRAGCRGQALPAAPSCARSGRKPAPPEQPEPPLAPQEPVRVLLLVDDEDDVRQVLAQHLAAGGYQVVEAENPDAASKRRES